jgi:hypothetical protein
MSHPRVCVCGLPVMPATYTQCGCRYSDKDRLDFQERQAWLAKHQGNFFCVSADGTTMTQKGTWLDIDGKVLVNMLLKFAKFQKISVPQAYMALKSWYSLRHVCLR